MRETTRYLIITPRMASKEELNDKRQLAELTATIRNKFFKLKQAETKFRSEQEWFFHPILKARENQKNMSVSSQTKFPITMNKAEINDMLGLADNKLFGVVKKGRLWYLGPLPINIQPDGVQLGNKSYATTRGLLSLLTRKSPENYSDDDRTDYASAIRQTGLHLKADGTLKDSMSSKFRQLIVKLFELPGVEGKETFTTSTPMRSGVVNSPTENKTFTPTMTDSTSTSSPEEPTVVVMQNEETPSYAPSTEKRWLRSRARRGKGLVSKKLIKPGSQKLDSQYVYWNNVNELIERLYLLQLARQAGNTSVTNEIINIEAELREAKLIR